MEELDGIGIKLIDFLDGTFLLLEGYFNQGKFTHGIAIFKDGSIRITFNHNGIKGFLDLE